jgi:predicted HicB family RNase H-like nuclease
MVNINIEIPDDLHKKVKIKCATDEITLKEFVVKAVEERLKK